MTMTERNELSKLDLTESLTWKLLDENISEDEVRELERLMREDPACLEHYVNALQLHLDLQDHFSSMVTKK